MDPRSNDDPSCGSSFQVELLVESVGSLMRGQMWLEVLVLALLSSMSSAGVVEYNLTIGYFIARPEENSSSVSAGRMAAADKSFF